MLDVEDVVEMAVTIAVDYMSVEAEKNPENFRIDATEALKQLKSPEEDVMLRVFQDLASAQKEVVKMIVMGSLTKFILSSEEYKVWLEEESSVSYRSYNNSARILDLQGLDYTPSMSPERSSSPERYVINDLAFQKASLRRSLQKPSRRPSITGSSEPGQIIEETFHQRPNSRRGSRRISAFRGLLQQQHLQRLQRPPVEDNGEGNLTSKAIANFEQGILDASLVHNKWLTSLIQCCEHLPLSMSIASASPSKPGFPLIYVNQNFMKIAGYEKSEIIGRNCRFLQDETAEKESIQLMRTALREAKPVKVYITNVTKDGKHFRNLLAMKPLFDQHGRYRYVLGCQFSLSNNGLFNHSNFILLSQILKIFPDTIVSAPHEEDGNW
jgi:PAS domain S-box-containing protein